MSIMSKLLSSSFTATAMAMFLMIISSCTLVHSQDDTFFGFGSFVPKSDELFYQGGAHVPEGSDFVRLTQTDSSGKPLSWNTGRVFYTRPVKLWEASRQASFETAFNFRITPSMFGAADGLVFFIAPLTAVFDDTTSGANFGIFNGSGTAHSVFAAEFDTYINGWDPRYRHIGIDIESRVSKATAKFESATGGVVNARINYDANTKTITVEATNSYERASVSYNFDLKTILPQWVEVGISASTGLTTSYLGVHDLISWHFTSSLVTDTTLNHQQDTYIRQIVV